jgi:hypothetical protein
MHPLSLSDYQLQLVQDAAKAIPPDWRHRFLEAIADRLLPLEQITDCAVSEAVTFVLAQMNVVVIEPSCIGDRV